MFLYIYIISLLSTVTIYASIETLKSPTGHIAHIVNANGLTEESILFLAKTLPNTKFFIADPLNCHHLKEQAHKLRRLHDGSFLTSSTIGLIQTLRRKHQISISSLDHRPDMLTLTNSKGIPLRTLRMKHQVANHDLLQRLKTLDAKRRDAVEHYITTMLNALDKRTLSICNEFAHEGSYHAQEEFLPPQQIHTELYILNAWKKHCEHELKKAHKSNNLALFEKCQQRYIDRMQWYNNKYDLLSEIISIQRSVLSLYAENIELNALIEALLAAQHDTDVLFAVPIDSCFNITHALKVLCGYKTVRSTGKTNVYNWDISQKPLSYYLCPVLYTDATAVPWKEQQSLSLEQLQSHCKILHNPSKPLPEPKKKRLASDRIK